MSILFGFLNMFFMGLSSAISKKPTQALGEVNFLVRRTQLTSLGLLLVLLFNFSTAVFNFKYVSFGLLLSIISYFALMFMYQSFKVGKLGVVSPITSSYPLFSILLTVIFFHVELKFLQIISILLIFGGIVASSIDFGSFKDSVFLDKKSGILQAIGCCLCFGLFFFLAQYPNLKLGSYLSSFVFEVGILLCAIVHSFFVPKLDESKISRKVNISVSVIALFSVLAIVFFYYGLRYYNAPIVLAVSGASPLIIMLYGFLAYGEKLTPKQMATGFLTVLGIVLLSLK